LEGSELLLYGFCCWAAKAEAAGLCASLARSEWYGFLVIREGGGPNEVSMPLALKEAGGLLAEGDRLSDLDDEVEMDVDWAKVVGDRRPETMAEPVGGLEVLWRLVLDRFAMWRSETVGDLRTEEGRVFLKPFECGRRSVSVGWRLWLCGPGAVDGRLSDKLCDDEACKLKGSRRWWAVACRDGGTERDDGGESEVEEDEKVARVEFEEFEDLLTWEDEGVEPGFSRDAVPAVRGGHDMDMELTIMMRW
jgi:hypothetical protein